jgi:predicted ArsR family transcriptional regulator
MALDVAAGLEDVGALGLLRDPVRRRLYEFVALCGRPVDRVECASAAGIDRGLAAYHLDRLVAHGLLEASYARPPGRSGPGAGRPPKLYRRADRDFVVATPARDYRLLAELLALTVDEGGTGTRAEVGRAARALGHRLGADARHRGDRLEAALRSRGYEPATSDDGTTRLRNCPFNAVASRHAALVCELNLALLEGLVAGLEADAARASLEPADGSCCVVIRCT